MDDRLNWKVVTRPVHGILFAALLSVDDMGYHVERSIPMRKLCGNEYVYK